MLRRQLHFQARLAARSRAAHSVADSWSRTVRLGDGVSMPAIGSGMLTVPDDDAERLVATALATGFRHIDTAELCASASDQSSHHFVFALLLASLSLHVHIAR